MTFEFRLPDIGEGVIEGEIVKWLVRPGDKVDEDQPMVEVMTDKATVVIPSPKPGVIRETRGREGEMAKVHEVLVVIDTGEAAPAAAPRTESVTLAAAPAPAAPAAVPQTPVAAPPAPVAPVAAPAPEVAADRSEGDRVLAAPATRRLARELGVDLNRVTASGPGGRVMAEDVRAAAGQRPAAPAEVPARVVPTPAKVETVTVRVPPAAPVELPPPVAPVPTVVSGPKIKVGEEDKVVPVRGVRRAIWDSMSRSKQLAAHFTFVEECDCSELVELRRRLNLHVRDGETHLSYLPLIVKAVVSGLVKYPSLNGHVDEVSQAFVQRVGLHIGIAVSTDRGLMVPVVRNADQRSLLELSTEISRLADAARTGKISPSDLGGSTFTVTSLGKEGGIFATPIINHPEVAIMGVHRMISRPVVDEKDQIVVRPMMNLSLSFDHRLIDGHIGAAFTYHVIRLLERPDRLLLEMR